MSRRFSPAVGFAFVLFLAWTARGAAQVASEIALTRAEIQTDRQAIIAANLGLTDAEAEAFWPIYRDYRQQMAHVDDRLVKLIQGYAATRDSLTDEQASKLVDDYFSIQSDQLSVKKKYVSQFGKVLTSRKVARFYQIENKLDAVVRLDLASVIPLVR